MWLSYRGIGKKGAGMSRKRAAVWVLLLCFFAGCTQKKDMSAEEEILPPKKEQDLEDSSLNKDNLSEKEQSAEKDSVSEENILSGKETTSGGGDLSLGETVPTTIPLPQSQLEEFEIEGDTLISYRGTKKEVVVPDGIKVIGEKAFFNQSNLLSIVLPEGVTTIEDAAFNGCQRLEEIEMPDSLQIIGSRAFSGCQALKSIDLQNVLQIGSYAFYKCYALTAVSLTKVENLETGAFSNAGLEAVDGMQNLEEIGDYAFEGTLFWENYWDTDGFFIRNHILILAVKSGKRLEIPEGVQVIAPGAFRGISAQTLVIPESVKEIRGGAFEGSNLTVIYAPEQEISLGYHVFEWENLEKIEVLPLSGEEKKNSDFLILGDTLLSYRGTATEVIVPDGVKIIGEEAFAEREDIVSVHLPEGLISIRQNAFGGCVQLASVSLPDSLCSILDAAFSGCILLEEINLNHVQEIGEDVFRRCRQLKTVDLTNAKEIGDNAFLYSDVSQVYGMGQLLSFGDNVFGNTPFSEEEVDGMRIVGNVLLSGKNCTGDLVIPEGVAIIANQAFKGSGITSVKCPDSLKKIGAWAFSSCADLEQFIMGDSVMFLGARAFSDDKNLSDIRLSASLKEIPETAFCGCEALQMLTIPQSCDASNLSFFDPENFAAKEKKRLITLPPTWRIPKFLKDTDNNNYKVYTTKIFPGSGWERAAKEYGFEISTLELMAKEVTLEKGERYWLIFNSGAKADWYALDPSVVSVDENGMICGLCEGETTVIGEIYGEKYNCKILIK